jgi:hypothetical protein
MRIVMSLVMAAVLVGAPAKAAPDQPPEVKLCFGLVQMIDGAARMRMALVSGDSVTLRLAARSVDQGYEDARDAAAILGSPSMDTATRAVQKVTTLATIANVIRQPDVFVPPLDELVTEATTLATEANCSTVLTEQAAAATPRPAPTPS